MIAMKWYKLNEDHTVELLPDGEYPLIGDFKDPAKHVGNTFIGDQRISTVFLHFDHGINFGEPTEVSDPVLFESMIFEGPHNEYQRRYYTYNEALEGHNNLVKALEEERHPDFYFNDQINLYDYRN
jgi:hypothetical protein